MRPSSKVGPAMAGTTGPVPPGLSKPTSLPHLKLSPGSLKSLAYKNLNNEFDSKNGTTNDFDASINNSAMFLFFPSIIGTLHSNFNCAAQFIVSYIIVNLQFQF